MFVGHSLLAFAVVAAVARATGVGPRRALALGVISGAFAAVPDADMAYAVSGLVGVNADGVLAVTGAFWSASTVVHRSMTHSLVVAPVAAAAFACFAWRGRAARPVAALGFAVLVATTWYATSLHGALGLVVFGAFAISGVAVAVAAREFTTVDARSTFALALFGLASHPWGDLFTGEAPAMLWPLDASLLGTRVVLSGDATMHLLGAFAIELAVIALAVVVYATLTDRPLDVDRRSVVGVAYGAVVLAIPAPTLELSYPFVFSILAVGILSTTPHLYRARVADGGTNPAATIEIDVDQVLEGVATGLTAVAFALLAYAVSYAIAV